MFLCVFMSRPINLAKLPQHRAMNYPLVTTKCYQLKRVTKAGKVGEKFCPFFSLLVVECVVLKNLSWLCELLFFKDVCLKQILADCTDKCTY